MAKITVFIDNAWLHRNQTRLGNEYGARKYKIDYGKLPQLLTRLVAQELNCQNPELTRTYLFDGKPVNFAPQDTEFAEKPRRFFDTLREDHGYDVELFPIDYRGRRLRAVDRDPTDRFQPRQCCVDVAMGSKMVHLSALPDTCDIVVPVIGDIDFAPALQCVRSWGKRVVIASIKGSCNAVFSQAIPQLAVRDTKIIWLNEYLSELELRHDTHRLECQSRGHSGDRMEYTTFYPRKGGKFFCDRCREAHKKQEREDKAPSAMAA